MGKIAFVFAGQGAQSVGMGKSLYNHSEAARSVFDEIERVRTGTLHQCFFGTEDDLGKTLNTQPCLFSVELAAAAALEENGITADMAAGFSLGELAALTYSGVVVPETGLSLVMQRAALMQQAAQAHPASMAAVLKLSNEAVEKLCASFSAVYPVNYNCSGQVAVSASEQELQQFLEAVRAAGGRAIPLKVSGGFHCPFMADAAAAFSDVLAQTAFSDPRIPIYSNCSGKRYENSEIKTLLAQQIDHPVRWEAIVRNMIADGADTFLELGPGKTLCGLIRRIDPTVRVFGVSDRDEVNNVMGALRSC